MLTVQFQCCQFQCLGCTQKPLAPAKYAVVQLQVQPYAVASSLTQQCFIATVLVMHSGQLI